MLLKLLFGDDIFISYSRRDGARYAAALADALSKPGKDFSCFLDQWGASADTTLSRPVTRALKRSSVLVLVGTPGAVASPMVRREIEMFSEDTRLRSHRPVLPINIDGALNDVAWPELTGLHRIVETDAAQRDGVPSDAVIRIIENSHVYTKRSQRTRWLSIGALVLLVASAAASVFAGCETRRANTETRAAQTQAEIARSNKAEADRQAEAARGNKAEADRQTVKAQESAKEAQRQELVAAEKAREAERQAAAARESAKTARSQELAARARSLAQSDPEAALRTAVEAVRVKPTVEAERALRRALVRFPDQRVLRGHRDAIIATIFSPDDRFVVTTSFDGTAKVWETGTGRLVRTLRDDRSPIVSAAISPNGKYLVVSGMTMQAMGISIGAGDTGEHKMTQITNLGTGEILHTRRDVAGTAIDVSRDSRLAVLSSITVRKSITSIHALTRPVVVEIESGQKRDVPDTGAQGAASFTPEGAVVVAGADSVRSFTVDAGPAGRSLAVHDDRLVIRDYRSGKVVAEIRGGYNSARLGAAGRLIAAGGGGGLVDVHDAETGGRIGSFRADPVQVNSVAFAANDENLLVAGSDNVLRVWKVLKTGRAPAVLEVEQIGELTGHADEITSVAVSHKGDLVVTASGDGTARLWDLPALRPAVTRLGGFTREHRFSTAAFDPAGGHVVTSGRSVHLWNATTGARVAELRPDTERGDEATISDAVFSADGKLIIVRGRGDRTSELYASGTGAFLGHPPGRANPEPGAAFSPDGKFIVTVQEGRAIVWSVATRGVTRTLSGRSKVRSAAFSPDGQSILTADDDGTLQLWSTRRGNVIRQARAPTREVSGVAFSPDGQHVFIQGEQTTRRSTQWLWPVTTGATMDLESHDTVVMSWGFSRDSQFVFTSDLAGRTVIRTTRDGKTIAIVKGNLVRAFSPSGQFVIDDKLGVWEGETGVLLAGGWPLNREALAVSVLPTHVALGMGRDGVVYRRTLAETGPIENLLRLAAQRARLAAAVTEARSKKD